MPTIRERLRYRIDQFFQSGFTLQVTVAFLIVAAIILLFSAFAHVSGVIPGSEFETEHPQSFWPSVQFWWVLTHIFDTYWVENRPFEQFLGTLLTLLNYLVFAGVIGLVGTKIANRLESIRRGTSKVLENKHFVILGWSEKIFPIINQLAIGLEGENKVFVILSSRAVDEMETELRRSIGRKRGVRWVLRTGSMTDESSLDKLAIHSARAVIILQPSDVFESASAVAADTQVVKSILTVSSLPKSETEADFPSPVLIAELQRPDMHDIAVAAAGSHSVRIVQSSEYIGELLLQTARRSGVIDVYREILSHDGHELHVGHFPNLEGKSWREAVMSFREAIPIGFIQDGRTQLLPFRYDPGSRLPSGSSIIALARDENSFRKVRDSARHEEVEDFQAPQEVPSAVGARILILGYDTKLGRMIKELDAWSSELGARSEVVVASPFIPDKAELFGQVSEFISLLRERKEYLNKDVLTELHPESFESLIVIGETAPGWHQEEIDARVVMTLLLLQSLRRERAWTDSESRPGPCVVAEIHNPANCKLAEAVGLAHDIVITNELVSQMIAQICREPMLDEALRDLLDEKGVEIYFKPITWYAPEGKTVQFGRLLAASLERGEIALGYDRVGSDVGEKRVILNPGREVTVTVRDEMRLCGLAETEV